jgi:hypothetical protein
MEMYARREVLRVTDFLAVPAAMEAFAAANHAAGETITAASSADSQAMLESAAAALGPVGLEAYFPAFATAWANCLDSALQVGHVHHTIGAAAQVCKAAIVASDNA